MLGGHKNDDCEGLGSSAGDVISLVDVFTAAFFRRKNLLSAKAAQLAQLRATPAGALLPALLWPAACRMGEQGSRMQGMLVHPALTVDKAVFLGQQGRLQALAAAHGPEEHHPRGERGVGSMAGLHVGQSWGERGQEDNKQVLKKESRQAAPLAWLFGALVSLSLQ